MGFFFFEGSLVGFEVGELGRLVGCLSDWRSKLCIVVVKDYIRRPCWLPRGMIEWLEGGLPGGLSGRMGTRLRCRQWSGIQSYGWHGSRSTCGVVKTTRLSSVGI